MEKLLRAFPDLLNVGLTADGITALFVAAQKNLTEIVDALLAARADVNQAKTIDGATPLFIAAEKNLTKTVDALIAAKKQMSTRR
eukprot:4480404-Amphidinium_carterae.1